MNDDENTLPTRSSNGSLMLYCSDTVPFNYTNG